MMSFHYVKNSFTYSKRRYLKKIYDVPMTRTILLIDTMSIDNTVSLSFSTTRFMYQDNPYNEGKLLLSHPSFMFNVNNM